MHRVSWLIALSMGCGSSQGVSQPSIPRAQCTECDAVATYAAFLVASGWVAECWESTDSAGAPCKENFPTPGSACRETKHSCKKVEHDLAIRCADNRCRVSQPRGFDTQGWINVFEENRDIVVTRAGSFTMEVEFRPRGGGAARVEPVPIIATSPTGARAVCAYEPLDAIQVDLLAGDHDLGGRYVDLEVTLVGVGRCTLQKPEPNGHANVFRCPGAVRGGSIELRQPDFSTTMLVDCPH
jgi:hypothetical protein